MPDTLRHSSYYSTEEKKKDDTQDTSMIKPPNIDHTKMFRLSTWMDDGAIYWNEENWERYRLGWRSADSWVQFWSLKVGVSCVTSKWRCQVGNRIYKSETQEKGQYYKWEEELKVNNQKVKRQLKASEKWPAYNQFCKCLESQKRLYIGNGFWRVKREILKGPSHIDSAYHIHLFLSLYMDLFHIYYTLVGVE